MSLALDIPKNQAKTLAESVKNGFGNIIQSNKAMLYQSFADSKVPLTEYLSNRFRPYAEEAGSRRTKTKENYSQRNLFNPSNILNKISPFVRDPMIGITKSTAKSVLGAVTDLPMKGLELGRAAVKTGASTLVNYGNAYMQAFGVAGASIRTLLDDINPYPLNKSEAKSKGGGDDK